MDETGLAHHEAPDSGASVLGQPVFRMDRAALVSELAILHGLAAADRFRQMSTSRLRRELITARCRYQRIVRTGRAGS